MQYSPKNCWVHCNLQCEINDTRYLAQVAINRYSLGSMLSNINATHFYKLTMWPFQPKDWYIHCIYITDAYKVWICLLKFTEKIYILKVLKIVNTYQCHLILDGIQLKSLKIKYVLSPYDKSVIGEWKSKQTKVKTFKVHFHFQFENNFQHHFQYWINQVAWKPIQNKAPDLWKFTFTLIWKLLSTSL